LVLGLLGDDNNKEDEEEEGAQGLWGEEETKERGALLRGEPPPNALGFVLLWGDPNAFLFPEKLPLCDTSIGPSTYLLFSRPFCFS